MRKKIVELILIVLFAFVFYASKTSALSLSLPVGGIILQAEKAVEIQALEAANFKCAVPGKTITIKPVGTSTASYLIPTWVKSRTNNEVGIGQWILGKAAISPTPITCVLIIPPAVPIIVTVPLPAITLYGTSASLYSEKKGEATPKPGNRATPVPSSPSGGRSAGGR